MLDVALSYNRYKFLGYEFLTWLWYVIDKQPDIIKKTTGNSGFIEIGNRIVLENKYGENIKEVVTIKGDDAGLEEGMLSLRKGAMVTELNIAYKVGDNTWQFTVKGESFHLTNIKVPEIKEAGEGDDIESNVLERAALCEKIFFLLDQLYNYFVKLRISENWNNRTVPAIKSWISG